MLFLFPDCYRRILEAVDILILSWLSLPVHPQPSLAHGLSLLTVICSLGLPLLTVLSSITVATAHWIATFVHLLSLI